MSGTTDTGDTYTTDDIGKTDGDFTYVLGLSFAILVLLITLSYASYLCNRRPRSDTDTPAPEDQDGRQLIDDDVLLSFPAFVYSDDKKGEGANGSGCSVCLADYKAADVVRLLPKCGHLFHRKCIDTWLKVHPSCPVCRNSPLPPSVQRS